VIVLLIQVLNYSVTFIPAFIMSKNIAVSCMIPTNRTV